MSCKYAEAVKQQALEQLRSLHMNRTSSMETVGRAEGYDSMHLVQHMQVETACDLARLKV